MAPTDASISKTVDDAKNAKLNDKADAQHVLADIYDIKKSDGHDEQKLKTDYRNLSAKLHEQGILPGLVISDSSSGAVEVTGAHGKPQTLNADALSKNLGLKVEINEKNGDDKNSKTDADMQKAHASSVTLDAQGRIGNIRNDDGAKTVVEYKGNDKDPSKLTTTNKDGSTVTYERNGSQWTETTKPVNGEPTVNPNIDSLKIGSNGDITTHDGIVTTVSSTNGNVNVTAQADKHGPETTADYKYDSNGQLTNVTRHNADGTWELYGKGPKNTWQRTSFNAAEEQGDTEKVSNVKYNPDGGLSYDAGKSHVDVEGYGAKHVSEGTAYGSYSKSFDPSGNPTTTIRTDNTTGKTELVSYLGNGKGSLLIYDTKNPDNHSWTDVNVSSDGTYSYKDSKGQDVTRKSDLTGDGLNQTPLDPEVSKVAKTNGVDVDRKVVDGHFVYDYSVTVAGEKQNILSTDQSPDDANHKLEQLRDEKLVQVEHDNHVRFSRDGETTSVDGAQVPTKTPNLGQLYGTDAALIRSAPDVKTPDGKPLQIDFLVHQGKNKNVGGFSDLGTRVVIEPNGGEDAGASSIEGLFLHELAHNGQADLYGNDKTLENQYANQLGFVRAGNDWLLITKDGRYFKSDPGAGGVGSSGWERTDKDGNPIDANGKKSDHPQIITNDEARNLALVTPASTYFPNPAEAGAEATKAYRGGTAAREQFLQENPGTYYAIKQLDQLDLNKMYGLDSNGEPKYIRNPDGIPVPNTAENQWQVKQFEDQALFPNSRIGSAGESKEANGSTTSAAH